MHKLPPCPPPHTPLFVSSLPNACLVAVSIKMEPREKQRETEMDYSVYKCHHQLFWKINTAKSFVGQVHYTLARCRCVSVFVYTVCRLLRSNWRTLGCCVAGYWFFLGLFAVASLGVVFFCLFVYLLSAARFYGVFRLGSTNRICTRKIEILRVRGFS